MLRLAGTNAIAIGAFGLIYAAAAKRWLTQGAFLAGLAVFFISLTALWVHVERSRSGARDVLSRIGRGVLALVLASMGSRGRAGAALRPEGVVPPEAGLAEILRPVMVLLLLALVLVIAMNVAGAAVVAGCARSGRFLRPARPGPESRPRRSRAGAEISARPPTAQPGDVALFVRRGGDSKGAPVNLRAELGGRSGPAHDRRRVGSVIVLGRTARRGDRHRPRPADTVVAPGRPGETPVAPGHVESRRRASAPARSPSTRCSR